MEPFSDAQKPSVASAAAAERRDSRVNPFVLAAGLVLVGLIVYFFGFLRLYGDRLNGLWSTAVWAWNVWIPKNNYEHAKLIPFLVAFLVWHDRDRLRAAPIGSSHWGSVGR